MEENRGTEENADEGMNTDGFLVPESPEKSNEDTHEPGDEMEDHDQPDGVNNAQVVDSANEQQDTQAKKTTSMPRKRNRINQRIMNKKLRAEGKGYLSRSLKRVEEKCVKPACENCKFKCNEKIPEAKRSEIFQTYWKLGDLQRQREFIKNSMEKVVCEYPRVALKKKRVRGENWAYFFLLEGAKVRVCQSFFLNTLNITQTVIKTVRKKINPENGILEGEMRGKFSSEHRKLDPLLVKSVVDHLESIPKIESHYCRKDTSSLYIDGSKSVADIHRDYQKEQNLKGQEAASYDQYRKVFLNYNIKFIQPKKDQCEDCVAFDLNDTKDEEAQKEHDHHLREKQLARDEKEKDKTSTPANVIVSVYDLQAVINSPQGEASPFYYVWAFTTLQ